MALSPLNLKVAAGPLIWFVLAQGLFVGLIVRGVELAPPPPANATLPLARCAAGPCHRQMMDAMHAFSLLAVGASAYVALAVKIHRSDRPTAGICIRAPMLLAVALSLAATVLQTATLFYLQQVKLGANYSCFSVATKGCVWAYALMGLMCAWRHCQLAGVAIWSE
ncbi:hypothetical protein VPH35_120884 [Triticum aestivum]